MPAGTAEDNQDAAKLLAWILQWYWNADTKNRLLQLRSKFSAHHEANTQFTTRTGVAKSEAAKKPAAKKPAAKKPAAKKPAAKVAPKSAKSVVASEAEEGGIDWEAVDWDALQKPSQ